MILQIQNYPCIILNSPRFVTLMSVCDAHKHYGKTGGQIGTFLKKCSPLSPTEPAFYIHGGENYRTLSFALFQTERWGMYLETPLCPVQDTVEIGPSVCVTKTYLWYANPQSLDLMLQFATTIVQQDLP